MEPPERVAPQELMDDPHADEHDLRDAVEDLALSNRWLGGHAATIASCADLLRVAARDGARPVTLLDAAGGGGDTAAVLAAWCRGAGIEPAVTVLEISEPIARAAEERLRDVDGAAVVRGDLREPPFPDGSFHVVHAGQLLHHVPHEAQAATIARLAGLASVGVAITDLRRERWAAVGVRIFGALTRRRRFFRHDGPVSVLRGFTPERARHLALAAGVTGLRVHRHPFARVSWSAGPFPVRRVGEAEAGGGDMLTHPNTPRGS